ncbi:MAG: hypothetical protein C0428_06055 [Polaromonas sp.]|nr:hypothetical protein [Polaromonas sp.]
MKSLAFALMLALHTGAFGQQWLRDPDLRICEKIVTCDDEKHIELTAQEIAFVEALVRGIPGRSSELKAAAHFGRLPDIRSPSGTYKWGSSEGAVYRATWLIEGETRFGSNVEVYFFKGEAYRLKWWSQGMMKLVQLTWARD